MALKFLNDGYFAGKVGIGIANPTAPLHIESADDALIRLKSTDNKAYISLADNDTTGYISSENSKLSLGANPGVNANHLNIDLSNNNVGIGTTSPQAKFVVSNNGAAGMEFQPELGTDTNRILNYDRITSTYMNLRLDANAYQFRISGSEKVTITSTGNVGIGNDCAWS